MYRPVVEGWISPSDLHELTLDEFDRMIRVKRAIQEAEYRLSERLRAKAQAEADAGRR